MVFLVLSCKDIEDSSNIFLSVNIKDSLCNKHCRILLHDVGGKLVQTLDSGVGWGWGRGNLHGNGDGEFFVGTGWGWGKFHGDGMGKILWKWGKDGDNFIYHVTLYFALKCIAHLRGNQCLLHCLPRSFHYLLLQSRPTMCPTVHDTTYAIWQPRFWNDVTMKWNANRKS